MCCVIVYDQVVGTMEICINLIYEPCISNCYLPYHTFTKTYITPFGEKIPVWSKGSVAEKRAPVSLARTEKLELRNGIRTNEIIHPSFY